MAVQYTDADFCSTCGSWRVHKIGVYVVLLEIEIRLYFESNTWQVRDAAVLLKLA